MNLRRKILPRSISDAFVTAFTVTIIPVIYYFELFVVLPKYYTQWSFFYTFHFVTGTLILFNVCSNFIAVIICDTSIKGRIIPTNVGPNWRFCSVCECIAPPRSWHCNTCDVCILKRDHHCMFTSCCIGHHNQRYFLVFVLHIFIATIYASYYNIFFVMDFVEFDSIQGIIKLIFPLATLFVDFSYKQMYLFLVIVVLIGCAFTGVLLVYHANLIVKGLVTHERNQRLSEYDLGAKQNFIEVLGTKWYLIWLCPFLESPLPHDGIHWDVKQSIKAK